MSANNSEAQSEEGSKDSVDLQMQCEKAEVAEEPCNETKGNKIAKKGKDRKINRFCKILISLRGCTKSSN